MSSKTASTQQGRSLKDMAEQVRYLREERVRPAEAVEHRHDGDVAVVAGVDHVELHGEPLPVDGVLRRRVPVHLLQPVLLPAHGHVPAAGVEPQLQLYIHSSTDKIFSDHTYQMTIDRNC